MGYAIRELEMRFSLFVSAFALTAIPTAAALAQEQATRTPTQFVCELTGDECPDTAEPPSASQPPAAVTQGGRPARVSGNSRSFSLARPVDTSAAVARVTRPAASPARIAKPAQREVNGGAGITLPPVDLRLNFATGSSELVGRELAEVKSFAAALKSPKLAGRRLRIEGHTDSVGSRASNIILSQARAESVRSQLIAEGVDSSRLEAAGFGFDRPLPGRSASAGANRRVEAVLIK